MTGENRPILPMKTFEPNTSAFLKTAVIISAKQWQASLSCTEESAFHRQLLDLMQNDLAALILLGRPQITFSNLAKIKIEPLMSSFFKPQFERYFFHNNLYSWKGIPTLSFWSLNDANLALWLRENKIDAVLCKDIVEHPKVNLITSAKMVLSLSKDSEKPIQATRESCFWTLSKLGVTQTETKELFKVPIENSHSQEALSDLKTPPMQNCTEEISDSTSEGEALAQIVAAYWAGLSRQQEVSSLSTDFTERAL